MGLISRLVDRLSRPRRAEESVPRGRRIHAGESSVSSSATLHAKFSEAVDYCAAQQYQLAIACLEEVVDAKPDWVDAHYQLGLALYRLSRFEEAADEFSIALCHAPTASKALLGLAHAEKMQGKSEEALVTVERMLRHEPSANAYNLRGTLLLEKNEVSGALESFENAVAADPDDAVGYSNLGYVLFREVGEYRRGAQHILRALQLDPENESAQCNYLMVLSHDGEYEQALAMADRLLSANAQLHEARLDRALVLLMLGKFDRAWDDYEARKTVRCNYNPRSFPCPEWQGEDLHSKTIVVYGEQGLGDEVMFASCYRDLVSRAGRCIIECEPRLTRLFERSFGGAHVVAGKQSTALPEWWTREPKIDFHVAAGSLPRHLRRNRDCFPRHSGYLHPDPQRLAYWRERIRGLGTGLKVGISWRGGVPSTRRELRSIDLSAWAPIFQIQGAQFISLQYGDTSDERRRLTRELAGDLHCWQEAIDDLDEMAALIGALDLVISVCTAAIHIAGAVGRPVWVLVPSCPEWRYQVSGESMPWYPSARLFRQRIAGDWGAVMAEVAHELRERLDVSNDVPEPAP